jgi:hypothetical protein
VVKLFWGIGLGVSGCKAENVIHCIKWALEHDPNPTVRIQGCEAVANLNLPLAPISSEDDDMLRTATSMDILSNSTSRRSVSGLYQNPMNSDKPGLLGVGNLQKEVHFLGRASVSIVPLDAKFESELSQNMSILMHGLAMHDPSPSVRSAAESSLRRINAYRVELNLATRYQETNSSDPHFFTNEATVIREVKELTTKEAVTGYIMST